MFLYGKNSVRERLKANPRSIQKIWLQESLDDQSIHNIIKANPRIEVKRVSAQELKRVRKQEDNLQGIVAQVQPFSYTPIEDLLQKALDKQFSLLFLDRVYDPHNLGAIIRTAACFGGFGVVIPKHKACEVTEAVLHVACGGENFVPVALVTNLSDAIRKAKQAGIWIAGAVVEGGQDIAKTSLPFPLGLVLGSEGEGVRYGLDKQVEIKLTIPMKGAALSLNVTIAGAIFCHHICQQRADSTPGIKG